MQTDDNTPYSYSRNRTGTSLQVRLMQGSVFKCKLHSTVLNDIPPHEPPLQATIMDKSLGTNLHLWRFFIYAKQSRANSSTLGQPLPLVQSLNSPFFPHHIGAEPGRAKEESRITCMRMPRTNQSKITRSQPRRSRQCVAQCLFQLAL